jgi:hypothetical protein
MLKAAKTYDIATEKSLGMVAKPSPSHFFQSTQNPNIQVHNGRATQPATMLTLMQDLFTLLSKFK